MLFLMLLFVYGVCVIKKTKTFRVVGENKRLWTLFISKVTAHAQKCPRKDVKAADQIDLQIN